jgi:hypothetical protein
MLLRSIMTRIPRIKPKTEAVMPESSTASGIKPKQTTLVIIPAANDSSQHMTRSDERLKSSAEIKPPSPIARIPAPTLNQIICIFLLPFVNHV